MKRPIFIVGTGRSGTHFTCRCLHGFTHIFDPLSGKEKGDLLKSIAKAAIHHRAYPNTAVEYYKVIIQKSGAESIFIDQHHPNLFFTGEIVKLFNQPIFLYPDRPLYQIVASMMNHSGVLNWYEYARKSLKQVFFGNQVPIPNQFLGVFSHEDLTDLPLHKLCALRSISHRNRANMLIKNGIDLRFINYERLVENQLNEFRRVFSNSELKQMGDFYQAEESERSTVTKFKETLDESQIRDVAVIEEIFST